MELAHWLHQILQTQDSDLHRIVRHFDLDASKLASDMTGIARPPAARGDRDLGFFSKHVEEAIERGWVFATLMLGEAQVRTGHLMLGIARTNGLRNALSAISRQFERVKWRSSGRRVLKNSERVRLKRRLTATDGSALPGETSGAVAPAAMGKQEALAKFSVDLTERAQGRAK